MKKFHRFSILIGFILCCLISFGCQSTQKAASISPNPVNDKQVSKPVEKTLKPAEPIISLGGKVTEDGIKFAERLAEIRLKMDNEEPADKYYREYYALFTPFMLEHDNINLNEKFTRGTRLRGARIDRIDIVENPRYRYIDIFYKSVDPNSSGPIPGQLRLSYRFEHIKGKWSLIDNS